MANKKYNFVSMERVEQIDAEYIMLIGERSNGKSYAVKSLCIKNAFEKGEEFIYLRRFILDCKDSLCVNYFADIPVQQITGGKYSCIDVWRKEIYLSNIDEKTGKIKHEKKIGYCQALSESERYKSLAFPKVTSIIYEEFISEKGRYIFNEPDSLEHYVSTIFRLEKHKVYLVGNTISRICPYFRQWEINLKNQKVGEIAIYLKDTTRLAVYLTDSLKFNSGMFFGNIAKSIYAGEFITQTQPHLEKKLKEYTDLFKMIIEYNEFKFLCHLIQDKEDSSIIMWFIEPKTSDIKPKTRVISNQFNPSPYYSNSLKGRNPKEHQIFTMLLDFDKVCFSDNLTGTEFKQIIKEMKTI